MSPNSKNEVAQWTASRERLRKVQKQNSDEISDRLLKIGQVCAKCLKKPFRSAEHGDLLYNEKGLPK